MKEEKVVVLNEWKFRTGGKNLIKSYTRKSIIRILEVKVEANRSKKMLKSLFNSWAKENL